MQKKELISVLQRFISSSISDSEMALLTSFISNPDNGETIKEALTEAGLAMPAASEYDEERFGPILSKILAADKPALVLPLHKRRIFRWAVAASIIIALSLGSYFAFFNGGHSGPDPESFSKTDIPAPDRSRAMITLADGRVISLDSLTTLSQNNVTVVKTTDGKIIYTGPSTGPGSNETAYNTLSNPRGSKIIDITLSDGSHVWLNSGSSITYPVAFVGADREVQITGEAYFEIAHDRAKPFIVSKGITSIRVLGTQFNVNAYDDESNIAITLLEGSVKVYNVLPGSSVPGSVVLKPNQQAVVQSSGSIAMNDKVNIDAVMAWKNGQFILSGTNLSALLRQVSRWYDVEVVYTGAVPQKQFGGSISREVNLSTLLQALREYGIKCRLENRKLIVE